MIPRIGLTAGDLASQGRENVYLNQSYVRAVQQEGGLPCVIPALGGGEAHLAPLAEAYVATLDGLLLTGGVDMAPDWFGETPHPQLGRVHPERDQTEVLLARTALQAGLPILAICRGIQVLNVAAGGSLWQDIPHQLKDTLQHNQNAPRHHLSHGIEVKPGTRLAQLLGTRPKVNSFHHQSIKQPAPGFEVTAVAPDGVIEAIERPGEPFVLGVQWHPEELIDHHPHFRALFRALVEAAAARAGALSRRHA